MARKKINPRRRPATAADVKRAKDNAIGEATRLAIAIFLTVIVDKFNEGRVSVADLVDVLNKEYDIVI